MVITDSSPSNTPTQSQIPRHSIQISEPGHWRALSAIQDSQHFMLAAGGHMEETFPALRLVHVGNSLYTYKPAAHHRTWTSTIKTAVRWGEGIIAIVLNRQERNLCEKLRNMGMLSSWPRIPHLFPLVLPKSTSLRGFPGAEKALRTSAIPALTPPHPLMNGGAPLKKKPPECLPLWWSPSPTSLSSSTSPSSTSCYHHLYL